VVERQWASLGAMDAAYDRALADPEWQAPGAEVGAIVKSSQYEPAILNANLSGVPAVFGPERSRRAPERLAQAASFD
jgi:hypothetical protein